MDAGCSGDESESIDEHTSFRECKFGKRTLLLQTKVSNKRQRSEDMGISNWTLKRVNDYGLYFEKTASKCSDFYDLFNACTGKSKHGFIYPLHGEERDLSNLLIQETNNLMNQYGVEKNDPKMWGEFFDWISVKEDCVDAVKNLTKVLPETRNSTSVRSHSALINFYHALNAHFQEKIDSYKLSTEVTEESYKELLSEFLDIFLLKPRRGIRKSVMMIQGQQECSLPDLRLIDPALNILTVEVIKVMTAKCKWEETVPFNIRKAVDSKVLADHAVELLIDFQRSVLGDLEAVFGIICMQTSLIFTCLKINQSHCANIREHDNYLLKDSEEEEADYERKSTTINTETNSRRSGTIFYTKPYNYLVSKDRKDIMEFLFWLGINCNRTFTP